MSAIQNIEIDGAMGTDGIRRYHTTCKVILHSHNNGNHEFGQDVVGLQMEKNIKGTGTATVTLVGSRNYLNIIHPNDYINIYMDVGDGQGWTRVFFGFVDMIREKYMVAGNGEPSTSYVIKCSDFQKAFEKTTVYFNAWLSQRKDFVGQEFGVTNIGGVAMITKGITPTGSPADIIRNVIMLMFGFGSQFVLPPGYGADSEVVSRNRFDRKEYLKGELGHIARSAYLSAGSFEKLKEDLVEQGKNASLIEKLPVEDVIKTVLKKEEGGTADPLTPTIFDSSLDISDKTALETGMKDILARNRVGAGVRKYNEQDPSILQSLGALEDTKQYTLLDIIDVFSCFEDENIDGWTVEIPIWKQTGPLGQMFRGLAHEDINEFFFDLRPMLDPEVSEDNVYSRGLDEVGGNLGDGTKSNGITYVPCIVMREYPFGTISKITGKDIHFNITDIDSGDTTASQTVGGDFQVGALFSDKPNVPGRHTIITPSLSMKLEILGRPKASERHLDVAVIDSTEIVSSDFGRSDADHFNLFEIYPKDFHIANIQYMMSDILPISTPISIMRHGLRLHKYTTKFARYNLNIISRIVSTEFSSEDGFGQFGGADPGVVVIPPEPEEAEDLGGPGVKDGVAKHGPVVPISGTNIVSPIDETGGIIGKVTSAYAYRPKTLNKRGRFKVVRTDDPLLLTQGGKWVWHNGVDIRGTTGTPVKATLGGWVVASVPAGTFGGYGNCVVIKHIIPGFNEVSGTPQPVYSLYAHLDTRLVGAENKTIGRPGRRAGTAAEFMSNGTWEPVEVKAGDVIGTVGTTGGDIGSPEKGKMGAHLHLEYLVKKGNRIYPSKDKSETPDFDIDVGGPVTEPIGFDASRSLNPQNIHQILGKPLATTNAIQPEEEQIQDGEDLMDRTEIDPGDDNPITAIEEKPIDADDKEGTTKGTSTLDKVDTTTTRRQILRWGLLQDHW